MTRLHGKLTGIAVRISQTNIWSTTLRKSLKVSSYQEGNGECLTDFDQATAAVENKCIAGIFEIHQSVTATMTSTSL